MNLKSYRIGNFKSFGPVPQEIPIKPLTLVFGPNSAGKSSIIHSLLWLNHLLETGEADVVRPLAGEGQVDLGGFGQFLHRKEGSREVIWGGSLGKTELSKKFLSQWECQSGLKYSVAIGRIGGTRFGLKSFEVRIDDCEIIRTSRKGDGGKIKVDLLDFEHPAFRRQLTMFGKTGISEMEENELGNLPMAEYRNEEIQNYLNLMVTLNCYEVNAPRFFPHEMVADTRFDVDDIGDNQLHMQLSIFESEFPEAITAMVEGVIPTAFEILFNEIRKASTSTLEALEYLPPLRDLPERSFDRAQVSGTIWNTLIEDLEVREKVNSWLGGQQMKTKYRIGLRELLPISALEGTLPDALEKEVMRLLEDPDRMTALMELIDEVRESYFEEDDLWGYVSAHPDLEKELLEFEYQVLEDSWEDWGDLDWPSYSEKEKKEFAADQAQSMLDVDKGIDSWPGSEVWPHYLKNDHRFMDHLAQHSCGKLEAGERAARMVKNSTNQIRKELTLYQQPGNIEVSLQDVGVGISQVLPILVSAIASRERLVAIEQPEIHIHPALQAELGDLFLSSALGESKNSFLIETHSEHLILRILRRIRETTEEEMDDWPSELRESCPNGISPDDVAVLYVQPGEDGATVEELRIDDYGEFRDKWPGGFFEERANEIF